MNYPGQNNLPPQSDNQGNIPPQQGYQYNQGNVPPQQGYQYNQGNVPPQQGYQYNQGMPPQRPMYRRRRPLSRFQIRIGSLGLLAFLAGSYLALTGQAKNPTAGAALILGGLLVFSLFILLPIFLRRQ